MACDHQHITSDDPLLTIRVWVEGNSLHTNVSPCPFLTSQQAIGAYLKTQDAVAQLLLGAMDRQ